MKQEAKSVRSNRIKMQRVLVLTGVFSLLLIYLVLWGKMIASPSERTGTDFMAFYTAGRVAQENGIAKAYDISLQQGIQETEVGFELREGQILPYLHMPYLIPVLQTLVTQSYVSSFVRWILLMIGVLAFGMYALMRWFPDEIQVTEKHLFLAGAMTFFPAFVSLLLGQDTALLFTGIALIGWGISCKKYWLSGAGLALMTIRPHFVILFALPFMFSQRKVFWWFLVFAGCLAILSFSILGIQGTKDFINVLMISAGGEGYGTNETSMYNLIGLFSRWLPFLSPAMIRTIGWFGYLIAILAIFTWSARTRNIENRDLSWIVLACILTVPHFHYHDLTILLFPLLTVELEKRRLMLPRWSQFILQPLAISFVMLVGFFDRSIQYIIPYVIVAGLAILLWHKRQFIPQNPIISL